MAQEAAGWHPPNAQELIEASIPDGATWYELRLPLKTLSYSVDRWDEAIENLKIAEKMGKEMGMGFWLTRTREALARLENRAGTETGVSDVR
jgi:hypothetical protein